jgi:transcriptional regulator with XRE-family HTH domain
METIGQRIVFARRRKVMSQAELARAAGVAPVTVTRLENDVNENPRPATIRKLAEALNVSPGWLLYGDEFFEGKAAA